MTIDRTLANAPLVEVIAEIHWELATSPDGQEFDPSWFELVSQLSPVLTELYPSVERLVPEGVSVPLELLGRVPLRRFRRAGGGWPLVQLGQGLLTVNAVPPYDGWTAISTFLDQTLQASIEKSNLFANVKPKLLKLQYRDAFTASHGLGTRDVGLIEYFPFSTAIAATALSNVGAVSPHPTKVEWAAGLPDLGGSVVISASMGTIAQSGRHQDALVLDLVVQGSTRAGGIDRASTMEWFGTAHNAAWGIFKELVPSQVMKKLRPIQS